MKRNLSRHEISLQRKFSATSRQCARFAIIVLSATLASPDFVHAQTDTKGDETILPADQACPGFALSFLSEGARKPVKEFKDSAGNVVRTIESGKGKRLTFKNLLTGSTYVVRANGSVTKSVVNADGTVTYTNTGHTGLILFPTDVPAGPTTTLYVGRMIYSVDPSTGVFTFIGSNGRQLDVCALLAP